MNVWAAGLWAAGLWAAGVWATEDVVVPIVPPAASGAMGGGYRGGYRGWSLPSADHRDPLKSPVIHVANTTHDEDDILVIVTLLEQENLI